MVVIASGPQTTLYGPAKAYQAAEKLPILSEEITGKLLPNMGNKLEMHVSQYKYPEYYDIVKDPDTFAEKYAEDYQEFIAKGKELAKELKKMDKYNVYNVNISANGNVYVDMKDNVDTSKFSFKQWQTIQQNREDIQTWAKENKDELEALTSESHIYALTKSVQDYRDETGIMRSDLTDPQQVQEYALRMITYASNAFGTNPQTYGEIEDARTAFTLTYVDGTTDGVNKAVNTLPNMG